MKRREETENNNTNLVEAYFPQAEEIVFAERTIPYPQVKAGLERGEIVFLEDLSRQAAYYASNKLTKELGYKVKQVAAKWRGMKGYVFSRVP